MAKSSTAAKPSEVEEPTNDGFDQQIDEEEVVEQEQHEVQTQGPVFVRRVFTGTASVEVAVFEKMIDGEQGPYRVFNCVCKRSWKNPKKVIPKGEKKYLSSNSFRAEDLAPLSIFVAEAFSFISNMNTKK